MYAHTFWLGDDGAYLFIGFRLAEAANDVGTGARLYPFHQKRWVNEQGVVTIDPGRWELAPVALFSPDGAEKIEIGEALTSVEMVALSNRVAQMEREAYVRASGPGPIPPEEIGDLSSVAPIDVGGAFVKRTPS